MKTMYINYIWKNMLTIILLAMLSINLSSCREFDDDIPSIGGKSEIIQNLKKYKWMGSSTSYDEYSYGVSSTKQTWIIYFTSDNEGVMHIREVEHDSSLGNSRNEYHVDFSYSVDGNQIKLYGGSNFVFTYYGNYMMQGEDFFEPYEMTSSDYTYLREHKEGYHGTEGKIDTEVFVISDNDIFKGVSDLGNGWYVYELQFGFGASSDDAYRKGMTQMKLTVWADNGCLDNSYKISNYGKKKTYTLYLSSTNREWYNWIYVQSKDAQITFNYELEYYNSKNGQWYDIQNRKLTFYK